MELVIFFGLFGLGIVLSEIIIIGSTIANKFPNSKFYKFWYK